MLAMKRQTGFSLVFILALSFFAIFLVSPAVAQATAFMQSIAEASASDKDIAKFYKENGYKPIWTGKSNRDKQRRQAFLKAVSQSDTHGLPSATMFGVMALAF